ncbi:hypothetical protein BDV27DRAFT_158820 [Aspergillus caelatus]|uniref:Uncharacterized protein n=1 Tax=Aspergillus caelatus TaxID=61420 RepID=A0A5N7A0M9_9EURO|nr:uncharacterized protein BDV27DRAFT_158820 [Aspergillus caelatus]KAE8363421.1 hypothetical protein BDV27DRAFT_158820 [Aspergillus caelatus]
MALHDASTTSDRQEQYHLVRKYGICLEGPTLPETWPAKYQSLFQLVREADKIRYDNYKHAGLENPARSPVPVDEICATVRGLVQTAYGLRRSWASDDMWRGTIQRLVVERFNRKRECCLCGKDYWMSDLLAPLHNSLASDSVCNCAESEAMGFYPALLLQFASQQNCRVVNEFSPDSDRRILSNQPTPLVLGLRKSSQFELLLSRFPDIQATAIEDNERVIFPFLLLGSQAEKHSVGFESIERQSAFATISLLAIQRDLSLKRRFRTCPIVWLLANQGDECKVYAAVPDGLRSRIIELWGGSILRHDYALQLLLIVDMICDWAKNIFKKTIMEKLGAPVLDRPEKSHGATRTGQPNNELDEIGESLSGTKLSETTRASSDQLKWSKIAHIRSETDVRYQFRSISLPESKKGLTRILLAIGGTRHFYQAAQQLLSLFNLDGPLIIRAEQIYHLHSTWTNTPYDSLSSDPEIHFASLSFRPFFDVMTGQMTQELSCITASILSMELLVGILTETEKKQFCEDGITPTLLLPQTIALLRDISALELTQAAFQDLHLHLHAFKQIAGVNNWVEDRTKSRILETFWAVADGQELSFWRCPHQLCSSVERTAFPNSTEEGHILRRLVQGPWQEQPCIVAKLRDGGAAVLYCCVIRKDENPEDLPAIGRKIHRFLYRLPGSINGVQYTSGDKSVLTDWANFLVQHQSC